MAKQKPEVKTTPRETAALDALRALGREKPRAVGFAPAEVATIANISSSSQTCVLLKGLVSKGLVNKTGIGRYKLAPKAKA
jgi:DNA-binding IclR family transcriptional regulator